MKIQNIVRSVIRGFGVGVFCLLTGLMMDYLITQMVSQFFLTNCSEDCYFKIFNFLFVVFALLSIVFGLRAGARSYTRFAEK
jgi:hypothetical protein